MNALLPLMFVPLVVWGAVWLYLWNLDGKIKRLQEALARVQANEDTEEL